MNEKRYMFDVFFKARDAKGKLYIIDHKEEVYTTDTETAIVLGFRRVNLDVLRRPAVSAVAYRNMGR